MLSIWVIFFCLCNAMDRVEFLDLSGIELRDKLKQQAIAKVTFDGSLTIKLPIYFTSFKSIYEPNEKVIDTFKVKNKLLFKQNRNILNAMLDKGYGSCRALITNSFFAHYPHQFALFYNWSNIILDEHHYFTCEPNVTTAGMNELFWIDEYTFFTENAGELQLFHLHKENNSITHTPFKWNGNDQIAQHPYFFDQFYVFCSVYIKNKRQSRWEKIKIENNSIKTCFKQELAYPLNSSSNNAALKMIKPSDSDICIIVAPTETYYILGKKSYHNNGTDLTLEVGKGIKRLQAVHKLIMQDFEKACKNSEVAPDKDKFFINHHLRRKFLDHWISYKIAQIEKG